MKRSVWRSSPKRTFFERQKRIKEMITGKFDEDALKKVKSLKDYGEAELSDIGRVNPFGPLN